MFEAYKHTGEAVGCAICKESIVQDAVVKRLPCMHVFHAGCIDEWMVRVPKCPIDNLDITHDFP